MMPLKENNSKLQENEKSKKVSGALSTDEIISLLSKSNKDFVKESQISSNITNLFKKITPVNLAEKSEKAGSDQEKNILETEIKKNEDKEEIDLEKNIDQEKPEEKKIYTENEAKKIANDLAKQYYENGYKMGAKKTTEELQSGEKSLAVALKRTTDNLFNILPEFHENLTKSINDLILELCKEIIGHEIENNTEFFKNKIESLVNSIEESVKDIEVILNSNDYLSIKNYNEKNNLKFCFKISEDTNLERGDIKVKSGSIEVSEIVSNKIKIASPGQIDSDLEKLKQAQKSEKKE